MLQERNIVADDVDPANYDRESRRQPLASLSSRCCHWPVNDPERGDTFLFCAAEVEGEGRYCAHHARRAVGRGTESERTAHRVLRRRG